MKLTSLYRCDRTENIRMIQKRQIIKANDNGSTFENFAMLMAL
ncbi:hypothetical protein [Wolbachia endosymbiont of Chrysomya megacephala]|nr:hypothetical protein [Wolbachia endosymbiont of Chrysomya megacephala]